MSDSKNPLAGSLGQLTTLVARAMSRQLASMISEHGLPVTPEQWRVLAVLSVRDGQVHAEISAALLQEKTGITKLVDGLERGGLVERVEDSEDKRCKRVFLTSRGKEVFASTVPLVKAMAKQGSKGIRDADLIVCKQVLAAYMENLTGTSMAPLIGKRDGKLEFPKEV